MKLLELLNEQDTILMDGLNRFITQYDRMNDEQRLVDISRLLSIHRAHVGIEEHYLYPLAEKHDHLKSKVAEAYADHRHIETMIEHLLMLHVDEPGREFQRRVILLLDALKAHAQKEEGTLWPQIFSEIGTEALDRMCENATHKLLAYR